MPGLVGLASPPSPSPAQAPSPPTPDSSRDKCKQTLSSRAASHLLWDAAPLMGYWCHEAGAGVGCGRAGDVVHRRSKGRKRWPFLGQRRLATVLLSLASCACRSESPTAVLPRVLMASPSFVAAPLQCCRLLGLCWHRDPPCTATGGGLGTGGLGNRGAGEREDPRCRPGAATGAPRRAPRVGPPRPVAQPGRRGRRGAGSRHGSLFGGCDASGGHKLAPGGGALVTLSLPCERKCGCMHCHLVPVEVRLQPDLLPRRISEAGERDLG